MNDILTKGRKLRTPYQISQDLAERGRTVASSYVPVKEGLDAPVGRKISTGAVGATDDSSIIGVVEAQGANWLNNATDVTASYEVLVF